MKYIQSIQTIDEANKLLAYYDREIQDIQRMPNNEAYEDTYIKFINERDILLDRMIELQRELL